MVTILQRLASDLEGTLHVIAHAGHSSDLGWIRQRQADLRTDYGPSGEVNIPTPSCDPMLEAYALFMHVLDRKPSSTEIAQNCEEILYDYLS